MKEKPIKLIYCKILLVTQRQKTQKIKQKKQATGQLSATAAAADVAEYLVF
jgi:hypothetical protein